MDKREQKFCTELQKWLKYNMPWSFTWEAKVVHENRYNFKSDRSFWKELRVLKNTRKHFIYKHSDLGMVGNPCDGTKIFEGWGYFFFKWNRKGNKKFYVIEAYILDKFIKDGNKSISEQEAKQIADREGTLAKYI